MYRVFIVLVLIIASFFGGVYYQKLDPSELTELSDELVRLQRESNGVKQRNLQLKETLGLVKRQIQTDRIAYKSLQDIVENSESEQRELKIILEKQQKLLESLQSN